MKLIDIEAPYKIEIELDGGKCHATVTAPTVDAVPVVHGKWIHGAGKLVPWDEMNPGCPNGSAYCSICGDWLTASDEYPAKGLFCPNCGAKMDGRDDNG